MYLGFGTKRDKSFALLSHHIIPVSALIDACKVESKLNLATP